MQRAAHSQTRDGLGRLCFWLHVAILCFILAGWLLPARGWLIFYLAFLPLVVMHWRINRGACVLNNLENWLRYRRWRAPEQNAEEGAWLRTLIRNLTGLGLSRAAMDGLIYSSMARLWAMAWVHFLRFQGP
jgi:hypothetical protein